MDIDDSLNNLNNEWDILIEKPNLLKLSGNVIFTNVVKVRKKSEEIIKKSTELNITIDLKNLKNIDSSGLSFFACIVRLANSKKKNLEFINISQKIHNLIRVSGLDGVLPIKLHSG